MGFEVSLLVRNVVCILSKTKGIRVGCWKPVGFVWFMEDA